MTPAVSSRDVTVGPHRLHLFESGSPGKTPVLWLHGSGPGVNAMANWEGLLGALAPSFYNLAPDILGFGDSSCPDPFPRGVKASVELRAHNTLALLDELKLDAVHVVGNSMGGMIAVRMAQIAPQRLRKMVLMGAGGTDVGLTPEAAKRAGRFIADPSPAALAELMGLFVHDREAFGRDLHEIAAQRMAVALRPDIARVNAATYDMSQPGLLFTPEELNALPHETLAIHGREDRVVPVEASYYFARHLPNGQLHVFPKAGHWAQLEQPVRFKSLIELFFSDAI
jgi:2-hydroxymuconate-semialdehyde hydrolase